MSRQGTAEACGNRALWPFNRARGCVHQAHDSHVCPPETRMRAQSSSGGQARQGTFVKERLYCDRPLMLLCLDREFFVTTELISSKKKKKSPQISTLRNWGVTLRWPSSRILLVHTDRRWPDDVASTGWCGVDQMTGC